MYLELVIVTDSSNSQHVHGRAAVYPVYETNELNRGNNHTNSARIKGRDSEFGLM